MAGEPYGYTTPYGYGSGAGAYTTPYGYDAGVAPGTPKPGGGGVVAPAAIYAGGQVLSAGVSAAGGKAAAKSQERSAAAALAYQKQADAQRRADYQTAMSGYERQWNAYNANRQALAQHLGIGWTPFEMTTYSNPVQPAVASYNDAAARQPRPRRDPTIEDIASPDYAVPRGSGEWNNWSRYNLQGA